MPSTEALMRHWKRTCWVVHMWNQADHPSLNLNPMTEYGWVETDEQGLVCEWDSAENIAAVRSRVVALLMGCKCRTGCNSAICGCRKKGVACAEGCNCTGCMNTTTEYHDSDEELNQEVDEVMEWVFGGDGT